MAAEIGLAQSIAAMESETYRIISTSLDEQVVEVLAQLVREITKLKKHLRKDDKWLIVPGK